jgi:Asp-tRNA(Asn)/Glu-tRNA(Gln) amidotransferase B subunit
MLFACSVFFSIQTLNGMTLQDFLNCTLPELPEAARLRLRQQYNLDDYTASVIAGDPPAIGLYDQAVQTALDKLTTGTDNQTPEQQQQYEQKTKDVFKTVAKFLCNDLFSLIREEEEKRRDTVPDEGVVATTAESASSYSTVSDDQLGALIAMLLQGTISTTQAKTLLSLLYHDTEAQGQSPEVVAQQRGLQLISDPVQLEILCRETIDQFPKQLKQYRQGGKHVTKMKKFLVGKAMARSRGNAHPERLHEALDQVLEDLAPGVE